jgi:hypothetical protein
MVPGLWQTPTRLSMCLGAVRIGANFAASAKKMVNSRDCNRFSAANVDFLQFFVTNPA